jgi:hypothetical protein
MQFAQLMKMREMQIPIPTNVLIESSTLQNKRKLIEALEAQEKGAQEQQAKQAQAELEVKIATMGALEAKAFADKGLGMERLARVEENSALAIERIAQAEKDRSQAVYEEIKAAKELQHMDLDALHKFVDYVQKLKDVHISNEESQRTKEEKVA